MYMAVLNVEMSYREKQILEYEKMAVDDSAVTTSNIPCGQLSSHSDDPIKETDCVICMSQMTTPKQLDKCGHKFCVDCISKHFAYKPACPICGTVYGKITGNQPEGYMVHRVDQRINLPGYEKFNTIVVSYSFSDGIQNKTHPNPGQLYHGTERVGYLPACPKGEKVLKLLLLAFDRKLVFTVGMSRTTGVDNCVTWNDIHHKTNISGGPEKFGYPDPTYLDRVLDELSAKGVTEDMHC